MAPVDHIDARELESWPARGTSRTLLYAEGAGLTRIHLYQTGGRFVFVVYDYNPGAQRSFLTAAAAGRVLPLALLTRRMTLKPERCERAFMDLLEKRGFHPHCAPFDHSLTSELPAEGIYGETLDSLVGDVTTNQFVGRELSEMPVMDLVCALAKYDVALEAQGAPSTVKYAAFEGAQEFVQIDSPEPLPQTASVKITSFAVSPLRAPALQTGWRQGLAQTPEPEFDGQPASPAVARLVEDLRAQVATHQRQSLHYARELAVAASQIRELQEKLRPNVVNSSGWLQSVGRSLRMIGYVIFPFGKRRRAKRRRMVAGLWA